MGGNLFQFTKRMNCDEYLYVKNVVYNMIEKSLDGAFGNKPWHKALHIVFPAQLKDKDSFGDLDIYAYSLNAESIHMAKELIRCYFLSREEVLSSKVSGDTYSFAIRCKINEDPEFVFQLDINFMKPEALIDYDEYGLDRDFIHSYSHWYNYGDLANFVGRLLEPYGLKYKPTGLYKRMYMRYDGKYSVKLTESKSDPGVFNKVDIPLPIRGTFLLFKFFGINPSCRDTLEYFPLTKEEIFKKICRSKYFRKELFLLQNRNSDARQRDSKRKMYTEFLEYIGDKEFPAHDCIDPLKDEKFVDVFEISSYLGNAIFRIESEETKKNFIKKEFNHLSYLEFLTARKNEKFNQDYFIQTKAGYNLVLDRVHDLLLPCKSEEALSKMAQDKEFIFYSALYSLSFYELESIIFYSRMFSYKRRHYDRMSEPEYVRYYEDFMKDIE